VTPQAGHTEIFFNTAHFSANKNLLRLLSWGALAKLLHILSSLEFLLSSLASKGIQGRGVDPPSRLSLGRGGDEGLLVYVGVFVGGACSSIRGGFLKALVEPGANGLDELELFG
jgi:hypothetical protein